MNIRLALSSILVVCSGLTVTACGGDDKQVKAPEASITETSTQEDMPPPPAKDGDTAAAPAEAPAEGPGAVGGVIKIVAMKLTSAKKGKGDKAVELKEDGTVLVDGKPAATIKGDQVDSTGGTSMLTVGVDGSLVGNGVKPGFKLEGDEIVGESGVKLTVGDDGTITATKDGKSEPIAKAENGAASKRAALVAAVLWMNIPSSMTDAKPAAAGKSAATKTSTPKK